MSPGQEKFSNSLIDMGLGIQPGAGGAFGLLQQYMDPKSNVYKNFESPYIQQFNQQTIPQLAEQFGGFGANSGALTSSGFGQALGAAGANLQANLAQMKSSMQRNSINDFLSSFLGLSGAVLGKDPFAYYQQDKGGGFGTGVAQGAAQGIPALISYLTNQGAGGGAGTQAQQPLTSTYADLFKTGAADYYGM